MKVNEGTIDRTLRVVAGLALIAWATLFGGPVWAWIGIVPVATGALGNCPLYSIFGFSTCPVKSSGESA